MECQWLPVPSGRRYVFLSCIFIIVFVMVKKGRWQWLVQLKFVDFLFQISYSPQKKMLLLPPTLLYTVLKYQTKEFRFDFYCRAYNFIQITFALAILPNSLILVFLCYKQRLKANQLRYIKYKTQKTFCSCNLSKENHISKSPRSSRQAEPTRVMIQRAANEGAHAWQSMQ